MPKDGPKGPKAAARRRAFGAALVAAIGLFQAHADGLLTSLAHGEITADAWAAAYVDVLADLHAHAWFAGRGVASTLTGGATPTLGIADEVQGALAAADQSRFVSDFREALARGDYDDPDTGEIDPARCQWRVDLYANRAHGTAHEGLKAGLGDDDGILWRLGGNEDHCKSCPRWAAAGPYTRHTLPAVPGDGTSECGTNCLCHLEVNGIPVPMLARPGAA